MLDVRFLFFFNDTATTEIYTLSLHDALPICQALRLFGIGVEAQRTLELGERRSSLVDVRERLAELGVREGVVGMLREVALDRKSTRLNSSHSQISYAVFCLKKKTIQIL